MSAAVDYHQLRALSPKRGMRARKFDPDVAELRSAEQTRRSVAARGRALTALARAFPAEYEALLSVAKSEIKSERGALPGDAA